MRGLYVIVDVASLKLRGLDVLRFAQATLDAGPAMLQLRAKGVADAEVIFWLERLAPVCRSAGVPLVANDLVDVAVRGQADVLHVGQNDVSPGRIRDEAPALCIGISTHSLGQLARALAERPAYVAYGPVFNTTSKHDPDPVVGPAGLEAAALLVARAGAGVPLVAIGGITLERAPMIRAFVSMAAVIGDLLPPRDIDSAQVYNWVTTRADALQAALSVGASRYPADGSA